FKTEAEAKKSDINALAELSNSKIEKLAEICNEGVEKMAELKLKNGDDDTTYTDWAKKLQDVYTEQSKQISDAYLSVATGQ
ncbi:MAG: LysM domain-containing protein, partial [Thomasclavelia ramosa]|nr:LysM domain-containing protein [Thomasclavelia ramosa]